MKSVPLHVRAWKLGDWSKCSTTLEPRSMRWVCYLSERARLSASHCLDVPIDFLQLYFPATQRAAIFILASSHDRVRMLTLTDFTVFLGHEWTSRGKLITALGKCMGKKRVMKLGEWKLNKRTRSENTWSCICNHYWDGTVPARISWAS